MGRVANLECECESTRSDQQQIPTIAYFSEQQIPTIFLLKQTINSHCLQQTIYSHHLLQQNVSIFSTINYDQPKE